MMQKNSFLKEFFLYHEFSYPKLETSIVLSIEEDTTSILYYRCFWLQNL